MHEHAIPIIDLQSDSVEPFYIRPIMRHVDPAKLQEPPHRHNFQELLWIKSGSGQHRIDQKVLQIKPPSFYLISKGQVHYFDRGHDLEGYLIRFTDDFLLDNAFEVEWDYRITLFGHFAVHRALTVDPHEVASYETILNMMMSEQRGDAFGRKLLLRHLLSVLLVQLERTRQRTSTNRPQLSEDAQLYQSFVMALEQGYRREHQVNFYANQLHVTPRQLSDTVRRFTGKTAKKLIQDRLILESKRYLQHTNASVKEIAHSLGFVDPSYFSKMFKDGVGVPPHAFKTGL